MTFSFTTTQFRASTILNAIDNARIVSEPDEDGFVKVEFEINNNFDALRLFHAGTDAGLGLACGKESIEKVA